MSLITSNTVTQEARKMSDKIAKKDIVKENELGQQVVLVPAGHPIPEDFDEDAALAASVPQRDATDEQIAEARGEAPAEDKARRSSRQRR